jgi:hypothetical protein
MFLKLVDQIWKKSSCKFDVVERKWELMIRNVVTLTQNFDKRDKTEVETLENISISNRLMPHNSRKLQIALSENQLVPCEW